MWYNQGTVDVTANSDTVTGTGTAFSANARVGDAFIGPDLGLYEVTNIASATVLSIRPNYHGATASGQAYAIAPMQGYVKESADRLRQLTELIGGSPWLQASTPEAAREALGATTVGEALFTAINAVAALNALGATDVGKSLLAAVNEQAAREAIGAEDASSLTAGLLDVARVPATLAADKAFRRGNILGTVSQSGGAPTGAVIERGSNANGEYVRLADGTQICWAESATKFATSAAQGGLFYSNGQLFTYPAAFVGIPRVAPACIGAGGGGVPLGFLYGRTGSGVGVGAYSVVTDAHFYAGYIAIGRWY